MREGRRTSGKGVNLAGNRVGRPKNRENRQFSGFEPFRAFASDQKATTGQDHPKKRLLPKLCAKLAGRRRGQRRRGLPVREIGEVMFADGFRQSFAGGRVKALPFFHRRVIRQRDGKKFAPLSACPALHKSRSDGRK
jgi:hypothetical protein